MAAAATSGIMAGLSLLSAGAQANAQEAQADYAEGMNEINKRRSKIQEKDAIERGEKESVKYGKQADQVIGSQKASLAAQGIDIGSGSAADLIEESENVKRQEVQTIRNNAFREALGFQTQQQDYDSNTRMTRASARTNRSATLLSGGLNAARYAYEGFGGVSKVKPPSEVGSDGLIKRGK